LSLTVTASLPAPVSRFTPHHRTPNNLLFPPSPIHFFSRKGGKDGVEWSRKQRRCR
jgi:hypothetical protein